MDVNQVWKSKESKSYCLKILGKNPDGTILVTFDFRYNPRSVHKYPVWYLEQYYEYAGYESVWKIDPRLTQFQPVQEMVPAPQEEKLPEPTTTQVLEEMDVDRVLFTNHTGGKKENVWKEIPS
jgi:hypothetical protein